MRSMNPFDYIKNINGGAANMMRDTENDKLAEEGYNPWLSNLSFTLHPDTILYANIMNQYSDLDKRPQYEFYKYGVRPKKRNAKWVKPENDEDLDIVCELYKCNRNVARDYLSLLSEDQLKIMKKQKEKGGLGR
tara:strand:- start:31038 stop:31439 length:402 start_codon:yes stop_codon:yes gene_type:complete